ncbi:MAG: hypothetical protein JWO71_755 [Candidatus Acidoferrum typicum]|nr:hypothetical protein [Candidatus Acidoferrum typicum]
MGYTVLVIRPSRCKLLQRKREHSLRDAFYTAA